MYKIKDEKQNINKKVESHKPWEIGHAWPPLLNKKY